MSEDVLLLLSGLLNYRIDVCRHATRYKNLVWPEYADCAGCDVEGEVEAWLAFDASPPPPNPLFPKEAGANGAAKKEAQRKEAARRQGRIVVLQGVVDLIERAELFAKPPGKYAAANREAKGVVYLALVVLGNTGEGGKVEEMVARLGGGEFILFLYIECGEFVLFCSDIFPFLCSCEMGRG